MKRISWVLLCLVILAGCTGPGQKPAETGTQVPEETIEQSPGARTPSAPSRLTKGFGLSPEGFPQDYSKMDAFLREVGSVSGSGVMFNGSWVDDTGEGRNAGQIPKGAEAVVGLATTYHYTPIIVLGWRSGSTLHPPGPEGRWLDSGARDSFRQMLGTFLKKYRPPFLFLGNENDFYYEQDPAGYAEWITFYNEAFDLVRQESPTTQVGPVFNYEHMAGAGGLNGWKLTYWGALEAHDMDRVDIVGLTVYPWMAQATPEAVPSAYLDPVFARIGAKPVAITETGWPAARPDGLKVPWSVGESEQVGYVAKLAELVAGKDVRLVNWLYLYAARDAGDSPMSWQMFGSVSLYDETGTRRPAYDTWVNWNP